MPIGRGGRPGLLATAARTAVIAGTAQAVTGAVANRQYQRRTAADGELVQTPPAVAAPPAPAAPEGLVEQLERLAGLRAAGVLDDAEFAAAKARLLG
jgi:hypothetical protein